MSHYQTEHLSQNTQVHPIIKELLINRGMDDSAIAEFFDNDLKNLPDLTSMQDMDKSAKRIIKALEENQTIAIYGDYDVDGTTSCALFYYFFELIKDIYKPIIKLYQPSRFVEGYGVHVSSIERAIEEKVDLFITVDCGITGNDACDYAASRGLDVIITDHHKDAAPELPNAYAVVNPNRRDEPEDSALRTLAGVGVAFCICLRIRQLLLAKQIHIPSIYSLLPLVSIGTICDLAKLTPMNLKLCRHGLLQIPKTTNPALQCFFPPEERAKGVIQSDSIAFGVGPMINSKGRLDHPERALQMLISKDNAEAFSHYSHLKLCNEERKQIQAKVFKEAQKAVIKSITDEDQLINIVYSSDWHEGVIGIVASRLVETFKVPAIVFTDSEKDGIIKASARTAGGLDLFKLLDDNRELFLKFGGHKAAAGLSMPKENLAKLKIALKNDLMAIPLSERSVIDHFDYALEPGDINPKLARDLEKLGPHGQGNPKPIFCIKNAIIKSFDILKEKHLRLQITGKKSHANIKGISFGYIDKFGATPIEEIMQRQNNEDLKIYGTIGINRFRGSEFLQILIQKIDF